MTLTRTVAAALTALPLVIGISACQAPGPSDVATQPGLSGASGSVNVADEPPGLSAASLVRLGREGTTIVPVPGEAAKPAVSREQAIKLAARDFAMIGTKAPVEAQYGLVTNDRAAVLPPGEPPESSKVRRTIENRPMWLLLYRDVEMHLPGANENGAKPNIQRGDFLVYVDAATGKIPRAETLT